MIVSLRLSAGEVKTAVDRFVRQLYPSKCGGIPGNADIRLEWNEGGVDVSVVWDTMKGEEKDD